MIGIKAVPEPRGIFPEYADKDPVAGLTTLASEVHDGKKSKAERDPHAVSEIEHMISKRWIKKFSSKFAAKRFLRGKVVLSDLIVITKVKRKKEKGKVISTTKKRIILNLKRSGVTAVAVEGERPELPRVLDVIFSSLELLRRRRDNLGKGPAADHPRLC